VRRGRRADSTGGFAAVDTNSFAEAFDRITEANSRYYLLGYSPPAHLRDGRFYRIEVRTKRPGLQVLARRNVLLAFAPIVWLDVHADELKRKAADPTR
jgi:hypothetical protein